MKRFKVGGLVGQETAVLQQSDVAFLFAYTTEQQSPPAYDYLNNTDFYFI